MTDFKTKMAELAAKYNISHKRDIDWHNFVYEVQQLKEDELRNVHDLKILPEYFQAVKSGEKTFEVGFADRPFQKGDVLHLREWNGSEYTGESIYVDVTYILDNPDFCKEGYVIMAIKPMSAEWSEDDERKRNGIIQWLREYQKKFNPEYDSLSIESIESLIDWFKSLRPQPKPECDNETEIQKAYREGKNAGRKEVFDHPEEYGLQLRRTYDYETGRRNPEWSEEETKDLVHILKVLDDCYAYGKHDLSKTDHDNLTSTIKSLRPSWKPSEEQMEALNYAIAEWDGGKKLEGLYALRNDLKKLM